MPGGGNTSRTFLLQSPEDVNPNLQYLLPHEVTSIQSELDSIDNELRRLGELKNEAMHQSSETWHDNALADAIRHDARLKLHRRSLLESMLREGVRLGYPPPDTTFVTIGSRVTVKMGQETFGIDIVGLQPVDITENESGIEVCSYKAPLAQPLIGAVVGKKSSLIYMGVNYK